jgi:hypothetical protein
MLNVLFVAPFLSTNMLVCLRALARLEGVSLGVLSHDPASALPPDLRQRVAGHERVSDVNDPGQLLSAARAFQQRWGRVDRLLGFLEQLQVPLGSVRDALGIPGMGEAVARNFREKNRMKEVLRAAGLPVARQALLSDWDGARRFADQVGFPLVLKPPAGLGSRNTARVSSLEELRAGLVQLGASPSSPVQAEEFIRGAEYTFETVSVRGRPVWHSSSRYLPGPLEVLENPWMQYVVVVPREPLVPEAVAFRSTNVAALAALGMGTGLTHMEWFRRADGTVVVSEVAARPPGVHLMPMMGHAHETDFWARWAELMVFERWEVPERKWAVGCAFFRGQGPGQVVRAVEGLAEAQRQAGSYVVDRQLPRVGQPRASSYEGEGWAIVRAPTTAEALQALRALVTQVRVVLG